MAEETETEHEVAAKAPEATAAQRTPTEVPADTKHSKRLGWIIGGSIAGIVVFGVAIGTATAILRNNLVTQRVDRGMMSIADDNDGIRPLRSRSSMMRGGLQNNTSSTFLSGVVTAVNGSTLTVAGNGASTTVTVSDSTTYSGAASPAKVNDTVRMNGAKTDTGFTASEVVIIRQ